MALWAIVSALTALSKDFTGLLLTRFFLGIVEAPYYPGALYILGIFYTRKEIATRISILYTGNILATAFAGLIAAGIFEMGGLAGISGWKWLFILQGAATFVVAVASVFVLPDDPLNTRWLNEEERQLANARVVSDQVGAKGGQSTFAGLKEAARDPKLWLFAFMQHMHLAANGFKNFFPTAVETLGFSQLITLTLVCPPYLIAGAISIAWSYSSGKYNERTWHITIAKSVAIFGFVLCAATLNTGARYFGMGKSLPPPLTHKLPLTHNQSSSQSAPTPSTPSSSAGSPPHAARQKREKRPPSPSSTPSRTPLSSGHHTCGQTPTSRDMPSPWAAVLASPFFVLVELGS